jgi:hypothetical protein
MRNKLIAALSAAVIMAGTIGGVVFAGSIDESNKANQQIAAQAAAIAINSTNAEKTEVKAADTVKTVNNANINYIKNNADNPSQNRYQAMIKLMRDNGFKDAARYMQTGNYAAMASYMNSLTQADFDKMIEIMNSNGYGYMAQMMQSIGREGMVQMHNSMRAIHGNGSYGGMMGGF